MDYSSQISTVVATTTAAVWNVFSNVMPSLWVFLIWIGAALTIAAAVVGIFFRRRRRGRRR